MTSLYWCWALLCSTDRGGEMIRRQGQGAGAGAGAACGGPSKSAPACEFSQTDLPEVWGRTEQDLALSDPQLRRSSAERCAVVAASILRVSQRTMDHPGFDGDLG